MHDRGTNFLASVADIVDPRGLATKKTQRR
jgi:hypothetical protein